MSDASEAGGVLAALAREKIAFTDLALSWIWIFFGMKVKTPESVMTTSFIFLMPLTFASNIFVGLENDPDWLQVIVRNDPVTHLTHASRGLTCTAKPWTRTCFGCWARRRRSCSSPRPPRSGCTIRSGEGPKRRTVPGRGPGVGRSTYGMSASTVTAVLSRPHSERSPL